MFFIAGLEIGILEQKIRAVAKGSNYGQEGSAFQYLVTGLRSNVAAFNELFGNKGFTLAVRSDLSVAMDMLCKMTGTQTVAARASSDEIFNEGSPGSALCELDHVFFLYI